MERDSFNFEICKQRSAINGHKHYHSAVEFYFLEEGQCNYLIGDRRYSMQKGDLAIIPKRVFHTASYVGRHSRMLINCQEDFLLRLPLPRETVYRNSDITQEIYNIFIRIGNEYQRNDRFSPLLIQGDMQRLLVLLERNENRWRPDNSDTNQLIEDVIREINNDFSSDISLTAVAARHYVSASHLSRTFKKETGMNFNEYLTLIRIKKAEQLLSEEPPMRISEIAFACGFNDSNYFSKRFHDITGCSPKEFYRRKKTEASSPKE